METFGFSEKADLRAEHAELVGKPGYLGVAYHVAGLMDFDVEIDIPGTFSVYNSLTAIAVCRHFRRSGGEDPEGAEGGEGERTYRDGQGFG